MFMLRKIKTGKKPAPCAPDLSSSWESEDDSPAEEEESEENVSGGVGNRRCRKCSAILRTGNDDNFCNTCRRLKNIGPDRKFISPPAKHKF